MHPVTDHGKRMPFLFKAAEKSFYSAKRLQNAVISVTKIDSRIGLMGSSPLKKEKESLGAVCRPHIRSEGHFDFGLLRSDLRCDRTDMHVGNKS